jgi:hypothetical protein
MVASLTAVSVTTPNNFLNFTHQSHQKDLKIKNNFSTIGSQFWHSTERICKIIWQAI